MSTCMSVSVSIWFDSSQLVLTVLLLWFCCLPTLSINQSTRSNPIQSNPIQSRLDSFVHEERPTAQLELILDLVECVQNEACQALKENGNELMDLAADDLLPLLTYVIASSPAFAHKPYTTLQFIRETAYHVSPSKQAFVRSVCMNAVPVWYAWSCVVHKGVNQRVHE